MKSTASEPGLDVVFLRPFFELQLCMNINKTINTQVIFWKIYLKTQIFLYSNEIRITIPAKCVRNSRARALDHSRLGLENKSGRIFLRSTSLLYKILPTSLGTCNPAFSTFYTSRLRWNSTMRRCFYHTDLGQNAVFHNFAIQIALTQYSGRSTHVWAF